MTYLGVGYVVDSCGGSCRVRLCEKGMLPTGRLLDGVRLRPPGGRLTLSADAARMTPHDLQTMARQNVLYNSFNPVRVT